MKAKPPGVIGLNTTFDSPLLLELARAAAERCGTGLGAVDALGAVILAYAAFEAFVNEVAQLCQTSIRERAQEPRVDWAYAPLHESVVLLDAVLELEDSGRAHAVRRYDVMWKVFSGHEIFKGVGARQDLSLLKVVRDDITHSKPVQTEIRMTFETPAPAENPDSNIRVFEVFPEPNYLRTLVARGLALGGTHDRWLHRICTKAMAVWACELVETLAEELATQVRDRAVRWRLDEQSISGNKQRRTAFDEV